MYISRHIVGLWTLLPARVAPTLKKVAEMTRYCLFRLSSSFLHSEQFSFPKSSQVRRSQVHESNEVIKICETWRLEKHSKSESHSRGDVASLTRWELCSLNCKHIAGWRDELDTFWHLWNISDFHRNLIESICLVVSKANNCWLDSERALLLRSLYFSICRERLK